jgi:hypothetical protein
MNRGYEQFTKREKMNNNYLTKSEFKEFSEDLNNKLKILLERSNIADSRLNAIWNEIRDIKANLNAETFEFSENKET